MPDTRQSNSAFEITHEMRGHNRVVKIYSPKQTPTLDNWVSEAGWVNLKAEYENPINTSKGKTRAVRYQAYNLFEKRWAKVKSPLNPSDQAAAISLIGNLRQKSKVA